MTTPSFSDRADYRDVDLIVGLGGPARVLRKELRDWIQQELVAQLAIADAQVALQQGVMADEMESHAARLRVMNLIDLPETDRECAALIESVYAGEYSGMENAYYQLQGGFEALLRLVRELERARPMISSWCDE